MATTAQFTAQPTLDLSTISTANTNRDGTGTITSVSSGPSAAAGAGIGKRISRVVVQATATTTPGMVRFYLSVNSGSTWFLLTEVPVAARTVGPSTSGFRAEVPELVGLTLPGGNTTRLGASTHNGETFVISIEAGLF